MARKEDLYVDQGATWRMHMALTDSNAAAVNLTGYTARMYLKRKLVGNDPAIVQLTTANGKIVMADPTTGELDFVLTDEETDELSGTYYYDIEIESGGGEVYRLMQGKFIVSAGVTK